MHVFLQLPQLFLAAGNADKEGVGEVETEHFHEAFAVDRHVAVPDRNGKCLGGGQGYKCLNILNAGEPYFKFHHKIPSVSIQISKVRV